MTLQDKLEAGTSRCERCNQVTCKILVDDGGECMAFCSWQCLGKFARERYNPYRKSKTYIPVLSHKGDVCPYDGITFCQERDCGVCQKATV